MTHRQAASSRCSVNFRIQETRRRQGPAVAMSLLSSSNSESSSAEESADSSASNGFLDITLPSSLLNGVIAHISCVT